MHPSSLENMYRCRARYLVGEVPSGQDDTLVIEVGGAAGNGGYREVFADPRFRYRTAGLALGAGVDIVLDDPYRLPLEDGSVDVVLSGQMLEHCEFFWLMFAEMVRVLKPGGFLFLIAPSTGPIHSYPVDCYRFFPDAYRALAKYSGCHLLEVWLDERGPWRDLVGVFSRTPVSVAPSLTPCVQPVADITLEPGSAEEEATKGAVSYLDVLAAMHQALRPALYLEIGVRRGASLALATGAAIGVDPAPDIAEGRLPATTRMFHAASDDFFRDLAAREITEAPDLAFIDGMHRFEFALRDFMNIERLARPGSVIAIDDIFPSHPAQAERTRRTRAWTGDIWKLHACLARMRPDLVLIPLDTAPTGLLLVAALDPGNRVLWDSYNPTVREYQQEQAPSAEVLQRKGAWSPADGRVARVLALLRQGRDRSVPLDELRVQLRNLVSERDQAA